MPVFSGTLKPIRPPNDASWLRNIWKTLGRLKMAPPDLGTWLSQRPALREALVWERPPATGFISTPVAWDAWTDAERTRLMQAFEAAWAGKLSTDPTPFANQLPPPSNEYPRTVLTAADAATQFFETAGACLAFEARLPEGSPRSLLVQDAATRSHCLDSRSLFTWLAFAKGYELVERMLPARPGFVLQWLAGLGLPGNATPREAVAAVIGYCGRFYHFAGGPNAGSFDNHWHYVGACPMARVIGKTVQTPSVDNPSPSKEPLHYIAGCFGTTSFLEHALRPLNIRVSRAIVEGHTLPHFAQLGLYLSHGDDPYPLKHHPETAPDALLIDQAQFDAWFGPGVPPAQKDANIGRRAEELFGG